MGQVKDDYILVIWLQRTFITKIPMLCNLIHLIYTLQTMDGCHKMACLEEVCTLSGFF